MSEYPAFTMAATRRVCARTGRKHVERAVLTGTDLCGPCHGLFRRVLVEIIEVWPALLESVMRRPARVYSDMPGGGGEQKDASSYWNPAATMVIADLTDWYGYLARTIRKSRPTPADRVRDVAPIIGPPTQAVAWSSKQVIERTVSSWALDGTEDVRLGLAAIVRWHHRWLTHYPGVGEVFLDDALRFQWAIARALETIPVQRYTITGAYCQHVMEETPLGPRLCEGQMVGTLRQDHDDKPSEILCSNHPDHEIPQRDWILYAPHQ